MRISDLKNKTYNPEYGENNPNPEPGNYYVSVIDGNRFGLLLGPFNSHQEALDKVEAVSNKAYELNPSEAAFAGFGTLRIEDYNRPGKLNSYFNM